MPVTWTISAANRLVIAVCRPPASRVDVEAYLDAIVVAGAMPFRKIFEISDGAFEFSDADMMALGARIQAYAQHRAEPMGPLAIVASTPKSHAQARLFATLAEAKRAIRIFDELHLARRWLDEHAPPEK